MSDSQRSSPPTVSPHEAPPAPPSPGPRADVWWGVRGGLVAAGLYSAWVSIVYALGFGPFRRAGTGYPAAAIACFLAAGVVAGAAVGALRPQLGRWPGALAAGGAAGVAAAAGYFIARFGWPGGWQSNIWIRFAVFALFGAAVVARALRRAATKGEPTARS